MAGSKNFFYQMLRIENSTNAENFIKVGDRFCTTWLRYCGNTQL